MGCCRGPVSMARRRETAHLHRSLQGPRLRGAPPGGSPSPPLASGARLHGAPPGGRPSPPRAAGSPVSMARCREGPRPHRAAGPLCHGSLKFFWMGRPLDSELFEVCDLETNPVSDIEFDFVHEPYFSVPIDELRLSKRQSYPIEGLWTPAVAVKKKYLENVNMVLVKLTFLNDVELEISKCCYLVSGYNTVADLCAMVHNKLFLDAYTNIEILYEEEILPDGMLMHKIYTEHASPSCLIELDCNFYVTPVDQACKGNDSFDQTRKKVSPIPSNEKVKRNDEQNLQTAFVPVNKLSFCKMRKKIVLKQKISFDGAVSPQPSPRPSLVPVDKLSFSKMRKKIVLKQKISFDGAVCPRPSPQPSLGTALPMLPPTN